MANVAARRQDGPRASMSIGEVLTALRPDFPDVTISKIRFLEEQGLIDPERTPSGYRKFAHADVERLRFVLSVQRDHYLPLRVIRDHLDALDAGLDPPPLPGAPRVPRLVPDMPAPEPPTTYSRRELLAAGNAEEFLLDELESYGLTAQRPAGGTTRRPWRSPRRCRTRAVRHRATAPASIPHRRGPRGRPGGAGRGAAAAAARARGRGRADETAREVAALCVRLHSALVSSALQRPAP